MNDQNYCSCPFCESVFILRQSLSKVICGNCGEMFDAHLNRVIRVGNKFVPDVGIHSPDRSPGDSSSPGIALRGQRGSAPSLAENSHGLDHRESLNLKTESRPGKKAQKGKAPYLRGPTIAIPGSTQTAMEERVDPALAEPIAFTQDIHEKPHDEPSKSPVPPRFTGKAGKKRAKRRKDALSGSSHDLDRMQRQTSQVTNLIADRRNPISTFAWSVACIAFLTILVMQIEAFAVPKYGQATKYRPYLEAFCAVTSCELPMFEDSENLKLMHTSIELHPSQPGAVRIRVKLINEAKHPQPYPKLQLTLTDRFGRIVGKRVYEPSVYLPDDVENKMGSGLFSSVKLDLAKPHENAYGFAVDVVGES